MPSKTSLQSESEEKTIKKVRLFIFRLVLECNDFNVFQIRGTKISLVKAGVDQNIVF